MKCLPKDKIPLAGGMVLHDSHAEGLSLVKLGLIHG